MREEINKRSGELNDAALESVSGGLVSGASAADVLKICETCPSRTDFPRYSCTYMGGDPEKLAAELRHIMGERNLSQFFPTFCPYLKKP